MKFCMKVDLWTLITGKLLWYGYPGNGCHGDQKSFSEFFSSLFWYLIWVKEVMELWEWNGWGVCCYGNLRVAMVTKNMYNILTRFSLVRLEINLCNTGPTPLTRAPREGQGPSILYPWIGILLVHSIFLSPPVQLARWALIHFSVSEFHIVS